MSNFVVKEKENTYLKKQLGTCELLADVRIN